MAELMGQVIAEFTDTAGDPVRVEAYRTGYGLDDFVDVYVTDGGRASQARLTPAMARKLRKALKRALKSISEEA